MPNSHHSPNAASPGVVTALAVSGVEADRIALARIFCELQWKLCLSATICQARAHLTRQVFPVVICDASLEDGSWTALFQYTRTLSTPPNMVVSLRVADERLWCEVLNLGGYDVLCTPFDHREVAHVVRCAFDYAFRRNGTPKAAGSDDETPRMLRAAGGSL